MISPWDLNIIGFLSFLLDDANRYLFLWRFVRFALSSAVLSFSHTPATTSISTNVPFGKVLTATADLAGYGSVKNSA